MTARLRRVDKLVGLADEALKAARSSEVAAAKAVAAARQALERAEACWSDAASTFGVGVTRAPDLDQQAAHLRTLRLRADASAKALEQAVADERRCTAAVVKAATDHRKLELWRDRIASGEREEEDRRERVSADELAARMTRMRA